MSNHNEWICNLMTNPAVRVGHPATGAVTRESRSKLEFDLFLSGQKLAKTGPNGLLEGSKSIYIERRER